MSLDVLEEELKSKVVIKETRKIIANKINICLFEEGSKIPSTIENECKQILMKIF